MAGWLDMLYFEPSSQATVDHWDDVEEEALKGLADSAQMRLRLKADQGVRQSTVREAQAIRVRAEGNRLVIDERSQDEVLSGPTSKGEATAEKESEVGTKTQLEDLFVATALAPHADEDGNLVFRSINEEDLFGTQEWQDRMVDSTVTEVLTDELGAAIEAASDRVANQHPGDRLK